MSASCVGEFLDKLSVVGELSGPANCRFVLHFVTDFPVAHEAVATAIADAEPVDHAAGASAPDFDRPEETSSYPCPAVEV